VPRDGDQRPVGDVEARDVDRQPHRMLGTQPARIAVALAAGIAAVMPDPRQRRTEMALRRGLQHLLLQPQQPLGGGTGDLQRLVERDAAAGHPDGVAQAAIARSRAVGQCFERRPGA
jgi:hypothetical protein